MYPGHRFNTYAFWQKMIMLRKDKTKHERIYFKITNLQQLKPSLSEKDLGIVGSMPIKSHFITKEIIVFG